MGRRWRAVTASAVALIACLPAAAAQAAPREFYGITSAEMPTAAEYVRMGSAHAGTLRMNLVWGAVQSGPQAAYDWSDFDVIVGNAAENGVRVLPTIYSSPGWVAPSYEHPPPKSALGQWRRFVAAAAQRYGHSGEFWSLHPEIPKIPIRDWQIWNEPNSPSFWKPRPNAKRYVRLLRVSRAGIKGADPRARIVLAGLFPTPGTNLGVFIDRYLPQLYRAGGRPLFDAVAVHPYNIRPRNSIRDLVRVRRIMARYKDRRTPLLVTEIGWATGGPPYLLTVRSDGQAGRLRGTYKLMAKNRKRLKIRSVFWFSLRDYGDGDIWYEHTGLFTESGTPKPAWRAFADLAGGQP